ncbi:hypothetical protein BDV98DRAFT_607390 [Pterulicium gracile]|uniref:HMG box domain-containing protein n=1 Tax=Pterulicium gracile TaxID=1884261 RepID=A0A5C3Q7Z4_9AGAR|nr:hypothetical protein BDV98DRAFT_607390 [Pterula gracilis]
MYPTLLGRVCLAAQTAPRLLHAQPRSSFSVYSRVFSPVTGAGASDKSTSAACEKSRARTVTSTTTTTTKKKKVSSTARAPTKKPAKTTTAKKSVKKTPAKRKPVKKAEDGKLKVTKAMMPPTKPGSMFMFYWKHVQTTLPKSLNLKQSNENIGVAAARWRAMSDAEKEPYHTQARDALAKHELAKQEWWRTADPALIRAINEKRVARKKPKIAAQRAREDRGPANAYALFTTDQVQTQMAASTITPEGTRDVFRETAKKWKGLPEVEKAEWRERARKGREEWKVRQKQASSG